MFPYYLLPDADDTQEPDEEQQAEESQPWLPSYIYAYVNPKPTPPPPQPPALDPAIEEYNQRQEERIGYTPHNTDPVVQPPDSRGGAGRTPAPTRPVYFDDVEAYGQRAEQRATAQNSEQDSGDTPSDFVSEREITEADVLKFCQYICEKDEAVFTQVMKIIEGFDPDDDEQTIRQRVNEYLRLLGLNDYFPPDDVDHFAEFRLDQSTLNERTVQLLKEKFPHAKLRTREELQAFLQARLAELVPEFDDPEIDWSEFSTDEVIIFYFSALKLAMEMYSLSNDFHYMMDERAAVAEELHFVEDLLEKAALTPLEDLDALLDAYGWDSKADAIYYFRHRVEVVYSKLGRELPPGWDQLDDPVVMANMLYDGIEEMKAIFYSGDTFLDSDDPSAEDWGMIHNAAGFLKEEPKTLTGTRDLSPDLTLLLFIGSIFFEPLDWILTASDVAAALEEGDVGGVLLNAFLGLAPFVSGKTDDFLKGINKGSDAGRALAKVGKTAEDFAVKFNKFNLTSVDDAYARLQNNKKFQHLIGTPLESEVWQEARRRANRSNSAKLRRQFRWAMKEDPYQWEWRVPKKGQDAHHIVSSGDMGADQARIHMENLGVSVNSAYNGVGLQRKVHILTYRDDYVRAINEAIVEFDSPDELVVFLETVARRLSDLHQYTDNTPLLRSKFEELLVSIRGVS